MLAQWPPTLVMGGPAVTTVGYTPPPLSADERQSSTAKRRSPRSRTVVTPAPSNALPARTPNINPPGLATHRHCHHRRCRARSSAPAKQSWRGSALTVRDGYGPAAISRTSGGLERL